MNAVLLVRGLIESAPTEEVLLSGAGDGVVKLWRLGDDGNAAPTQMAKLQNGDPVLSIAVDGSFLYCGLAGGALNIWNLDSHQLVKRITRHTGDLWAVDIIRGIAVCGDSNGIVKVGVIGSMSKAITDNTEIQFSIRRSRQLGRPRGNHARLSSWPLQRPANLCYRRQRQHSRDLGLNRILHEPG